MGMFNFYEVPRAVGFPSQTIVKTEDELQRLIYTNIGKSSVYISHNSFPNLIKNKAGFDEPAQVNVSKLFLDFDSDRKVENAQLDALKVIEFCQKENLPFLPVFSGSKGFHVYIALKPTVYNYNQFLKDATKAIHVWLMQELGLRTIDLKCAEPRRLCRVFYTPHVKADKKTGKMYANGMYCCPMEPDWIRDWRLEQIMRYATAPTKIDYKPSGACITLDEFLIRFNINIEEMLSVSIREADVTRNSLIEYTPVNNEYIKSILPLPCMHSQIANNPNPPHFARFAAAAWFHDIGLDRGVAFNFFKSRNYIDHKDDICSSQINNIYDRNYKVPTCAKLYENSLCVGKICPKFESFARRANIPMDNNDQ